VLHCDERFCVTMHDGTGFLPTCDNHASSNETTLYVSEKLGSNLRPLVGTWQLSWPPTSDNVPPVMLVLLATWAFIAYTLKHRKSADDVQHEQSRLKLAHDRLAQVLYEHEKTEKKRADYADRKSKIESAAAAVVNGLVASGDLDEAEAEAKRRGVYDQMAREAAPTSTDGKATCFAGEGMPQRMSAEHVFDAAIDEISGLPVDQLPGLHTALGPEFSPPFIRDMDQVATLMALRMTETLQTTMEKTEHARAKGACDPTLLAYASGQKICQDLRLATSVSKALCKRRTAAATSGRIGAVLSILPTWLMLAPAPEPAERDLGATRATAKRQLRMLRREQQSRLLRLVCMLSPATVAYLSLAYLSTSLNGVWGTLHTTLLADAAKHATLPDGEWQQAVGRDIIGFLVIFVLEWWLNDFVSIVACNRSNAEFTQRIRKQLFDAILRQDTVYFELNDSGAVCERLNGDCGRVAESFLHLPRDIIGICSRLVATSILLYVRCPSMLYRAATFAVLAAPIILLMQRAVNDLAHRGHRALRVSGRATNEMLRNLSTVREFAREAQESSSYTRMQATQARDDMRLKLLQHLQWPIFISVFFASQLANLWAGAALVHAGALTAIELVQLYHQFGELTHCFKHLVDQLPRMLELLIPADRVFTILESKSAVEPNESDQPAAPFAPTGGGVSFTFEGIDFAYPTMPEHRVLRGLSLHVPAGKTVALVGARGCGKSTAIELMKRSYDPEPGSGRVLVNGEPMQHWDVRSFRRHISVVSQSVHLFGGSIKDNLLYGLTPAERRGRGFDGAETGLLKAGAEAELRRIAEMAGCDFINDYPLGLETRLGTGGIKLSGGQRQCIAIARALIKRPALLILDEATSALDAKTQAHVAAAIEAEQAALGFTVVQIAHRLETLKNSDVVYYFAHGRVVEVGGAEASERRTAVDELLAVPIETRLTADPETGAPTRKLRSGFFHDMWNRAHGLTPPEQMARTELESKVSDLKKELVRVQTALRMKRIKRCLCLRLMAVAALLDVPHDHV